MPDKVKLRSDFVDYYDHAFDNSGDIYSRLSKSGLNRRDIMMYLKGLGLRVPRFGYASELVKDLLDDLFPANEVDIREKAGNIFEVIRYTDLNVHCGEGKEKVTYNAALETPDAFCAEYIPATPHGLGLSLRYLQVGDRKWWLKFTSFDDWRSNCGNVEVSVLCEERRGYHPKIKDPMFAIDFVPGNHLYAVDFNIAPGLGDEFLDILKPKEVYELVKAAMSR